MFHAEGWRNPATFAVLTAASHSRGDHLAAVGRLVKAPALVAMQGEGGAGHEENQGAIKRSPLLALAQRGISPLGCSCGRERCHVLGLKNSERAERGAHRVRNVIRRQVAVMLLDHTRVRVPELTSHHGEGRAMHYEPRSVGMAQFVKRETRNLCSLARSQEWALLIGRLPCFAVRALQK
jgi:hypothetical protein